MKLFEDFRSFYFLGAFNFRRPLFYFLGGAFSFASTHFFEFFSNHFQRIKIFRRALFSYFYKKSRSLYQKSLKPSLFTKYQRSRSSSKKSRHFYKRSLSIKIKKKYQPHTPLLNKINPQPL